MRVRPSLPILFWCVLLLAAVPILQLAYDVKPAAALPDHWRLPGAIDGWDGQVVYYSEDPDVTRAFLEQDIVEPGICPVSGSPLDTVSPPERRLLPSDVKIFRRLYRAPGDQRERMVILLITGASREGIHRPEWCIAAQGVSIGVRRQLAARDADGEEFLFGAYPLIPDGMTDAVVPRRYFIYWFEGPGVKTPYNFMRILRMGWRRLVTGRQQRWAYFSIQLEVPAAEADPDAYLAGAVEWLVQAAHE